MKIMSQSEAKALGLTRYFSGRPCVHGHSAERFTSTRTCVVCSREQNKARRSTPEGKAKRHKEAIKYNADPRNREAHAERSKAWAAKNAVRKRTVAREFERRKIKTDVQFKLRRLLRIRLINAMKRVPKTGRRRSVSAVTALGCSIEQLKEHLQSRFKPGMTWANWGTYWHIDHIRPLSSFDITDDDQVAEACHFLNLQPLTARENLQKKAKWRGPNA